jgi:hypothetical protein
MTGKNSADRPTKGDFVYKVILAFIHKSIANLYINSQYAQRRKVPTVPYTVAATRTTSLNKNQLFIANKSRNSLEETKPYCDADLAPVPSIMYDGTVQ